jgi:hypothetical protein
MNIMTRQLNIEEYEIKFMFSILMTPDKVIKLDPITLTKKLKKLRTVILKHESGVRMLGDDILSSSSEFNPSKRVVNIRVSE